MKKGNVYIGTSGWHYKHWKGTFYPADIKDAEQLACYQQTFSTVEINNSFYRLPTAETFRAWKEKTPKGFTFAVKASRYITHIKRLQVTQESIKKFFLATSHLEEKLGPILFQLPPRWHVNPQRLEDFLKMLPCGPRYAFEFRDPSWKDENVYKILEKHHSAFCIHELDHYLSPMRVTSHFVYVRLHGPGDKYEGSYTETALQEWAERIKAWQNNQLDVYVYFDNDQEGYAAFNAQRLLALLS